VQRKSAGRDPEKKPGSRAPKGLSLRKNHRANFLRNVGANRGDRKVLGRKLERAARMGKFGGKKPTGVKSER